MHIFSFVAIAQTKTESPKKNGKPEKKDKPKDPFEEHDNKSGIVVTGSRGERRWKDSPVATEVISRKKIEQSGARNLGEVLDTALGINVNPSQLGGSQIQLLGMDSKYVLILIDGQRVAGRLNNTIDLTRFKVQNIERVEIVKGASSALYGADAIGGVINIITKQSEKPESYLFRTTYGNGRKTQFGTTGEKNLIADVGMRNSVMALSLTGGYNQSPSYDIDPSNPSTTGNAFRDNNLGINLTLNPDGDLKFKSGIIYLAREQTGVISLPSGGVFDRTNSTNDFTGISSLEYHYGKNNLISFRGNIARFENKYKLDQRNSNELDTKELTNEKSSQGTVQWDHEIANAHRVSVGVESFSNELETDRLRNRYAYRTRKAGFLQDEWKTELFRFPIQLVPGVRYDLDSQFGGQVTPKLSTRIDFTSDFMMRFSIGNGFRPPTFQELYLRFENSGVGYVVEGNPKLKPEKSRSFHFDVEYAITKKINFSISLFRNSIEDLIQYNYSTGSSDFATFQLTNINSAFTQGVETGARIRIWKYISTEWGVNYLESKDLTKDRPLEGRAKLQGTWNIYLNLPLGWEFTLRGKYIGKRPYYSDTNAFAGNSTALIESENNTQSEKEKVIYGAPFPLVHFRAEKKFFEERISLFAGVENIFDKFEQTYNPIRPRFFYGGLQAQF